MCPQPVIVLDNRDTLLRMSTLSEMVKELFHGLQLDKVGREREETALGPLLFEPVARWQQFRREPTVLGQEPEKGELRILIRMKRRHLVMMATSSSLPSNITSCLRALWMLANLLWSGDNNIFLSRAGSVL